MQVIMMKVTDLIPYVKNPRKNDKAVKPVAESIKQFGFNVPITIDKDGIIITGHTRLKAAKLLGMEEVPVIQLSELTPDQVKGFRLVDNRTSEFAEWDFEQLAIELSEVEIDLSPFDFKVPEIGLELEEDNFDVQLPTTPKSQLGDIFQLGSHRLMCGDSTSLEDIALLTEGREIDLINTDPPYNVNYGQKGKQYKERGGYEAGMDDRTIMNDNMSEDDFYDFLVKAFEAGNSVLKLGGVFYIWHAESTANTFANALKEVRLDIKQRLIWRKNNLVLGRQDYQWIHEPCMYGWKQGAAHFFINDRGFTTIYDDRKKDLESLTKAELIKMVKLMQEPEQPIDVLDEDRPSKSAEHPTMKPVRLIGRQIANSSRPGERVLDLFGGSGTVIIACEQLGRNGYIMELDPKYVDVIIDRWETFTGNRAKKLN